jgi:hypothetical protein
MLNSFALNKLNNKNCIFCNNEHSIIYLDFKEKIKLANDNKIISFNKLFSIIKILPEFPNKIIIEHEFKNINNREWFYVKDNKIQDFIKEMKNKYTDSFLSKDARQIAMFITECRTRVSQSIRSFQIAYYKFSKEGLKFREPYVGEEGGEFEYQTVEKRNLLIDNITKSITVYREIDEKALAEAKSLTKIRESLSRQIVEELANVKYQENVRTVLDLFVRDIKSSSSICGKDFFPYVRSLMAVKKSNKPIYFKQQVYELLVKILKSIKSLDSFLRLTSQSKSLHGSFLAFYIAMFLKNKICQ